MHRTLRTLVFLAAVAALAGCDKDAGSAPAPVAASSSDGARLVEVPVSERHGVCLRLPPGEQLADRRADGDADIAQLRRASGAVTVYVGFHPDFPGFRGATRHAGDAVTTAFRPMADAKRDGERHLLFGHKRSADAQRLYVMFSGADSAFAGDAHLDAGNVVDCGSAG